VNILPLVFAFLIIFSCINLTFFREIKSFSLLETTFHSYSHTERVLCNKIAQKKYRKIKTDPAPSKKPGEKKIAKGKYQSMRSLFPPLENSKFNLSPLIQWEGEVKLHPLYEHLAKLLRLLYQGPIFAKEKSKEKLEYLLIDELLKKAKKNKEAASLTEFFPQDPLLQKIYHKMLRGTNQYGKGEGIPPLEHFLSLDKAKEVAALCFASPPVLEALFDKEITTEILSLEKKKWEESHAYYYFSKDDFQTILMKSPAKALLLSALDPYLNYSKQFQPRQSIGGRDGKTGIALELELK
jgi:hypothetical protein